MSPWQGHPEYIHKVYHFSLMLYSILPHGHRDVLSNAPLLSSYSYKVLKHPKSQKKTKIHTIHFLSKKSSYLSNSIPISPKNISTSQKPFLLNWNSSSWRRKKITDKFIRRGLQGIVRDNSWSSLAPIKMLLFLLKLKRQRSKRAFMSEVIEHGASKTY